MSDVFAYVGTYTEENGTSLKRNACAKGIAVFKVPSDGGQWILVQEKEIKNPCVFEFNVDNSLLYSISADSNIVTAFSVDPLNGQLSEYDVFVVQSAEKLAVLKVVSELNCIIVADFRGQVHVIRITDDGHFKSVCAVVSMKGKTGPLKETWQPCSRPHDIAVDLDSHYVYIADKGFDKIHVFRLSFSSGEILKLITQIDVRRAGCPRHIALSPDNKYLYCNLEFGNYVEVCQLVDNIPEPFQLVSTLPETFVQPISKTSEIKVHPSGKWLYVSNRGHNSIVVFASSPDFGFLKPIQWADCLGDIPRSFELDPSGRILACCNQFSNEIVLFDINKRTGLLKYSGKKVKTPCPVWLRFNGNYPVNEERCACVGNGIT